MLQDINIEQVKQYNASLKQYKDKAASLNAEIEYTNKELDNLCSELTAELGVEVNRNNVMKIYEEQVAKINSTLQSGNAVLAKIASEEQAVSSQTVNSNSQAYNTSVAPQVTPQVTPQVATPVMQPQTSPIQTSQETIDSQPVSGQIFGNPNIPGAATLPTMFNLQQ